jgi:hypothetical protein
LVLVVIGLALLGGALTVLAPSSLVPDTFRPLDHYVGTEGSVVGAVFGLGLIWAAFRPGASRVWVHLAMLYGILLIVREATHPSNGTSPSLAPIVFGLASIALLLALYPGFGRRKPKPLVLDSVHPPAKAPVQPAPEVHPPAEAPPTDSPHQS